MMLKRLFAGAAALDSPVAYCQGRTLTLGDFRAAVAANAALVAAAGSGRWLLACADAWHFAVGLFGLQQAGGTAVIPPNLLPGTVARMLPGLAGVLTDLPAASGDLPWIQVRAEGERADGHGIRLDGQVEFWTSGSTGQPKCVAKPFSRLSLEVEILERVFGARLDGGTFLGTVPHHHIYGCLFRILWPLASGRPFVVEHFAEAAALLKALAELRRPILVSSPSYLSRLPLLADLERLAGPLQAVFSSGGALDRPSAISWRQWAPDGVLEVYGSTESGGVGWRCQDLEPSSEGWTRLPDVELQLEADGALLLRSPRVGAEPLRLEDAARLCADGRFVLLGRLDRIVKLGEKRISLPELEAILEAHPWVARAALVALDGRRPLLGATVVLQAGVELPERGPLVAALRAHLALSVERVALPRRWRFPLELPYNEAGKLTRQALVDLFESSAT